MWCDKILLIMTRENGRKTESAFCVRDNLQIHSLQETVSKNRVYVYDTLIFDC